MFVVTPPGAEAGKKYPLVQLIHGGPVGTFGDAFSFRWHPHAFAAPGYVVAMVNFHGSSSFGQKWVESILGAHPDKPFTDVMKATDVLDRAGARRPDAHGGGRRLVRRLPRELDRGAHGPLQVRSSRTRASTTSWRSSRRTRRTGGTTPTAARRSRTATPWRSGARTATRQFFQTPDAHPPRRARLPRPDRRRGSSSTARSRPRASRPASSTIPDENHWILKGQNAKHWYGEVLGLLAADLKP